MAEVNNEALTVTDLQVEEAESQHENLSPNSRTRNNIPQRYKLMATMALAYVICNMDKVNMSVAIIPMSKQFGWNSSTAGLIHSSFFWGYTVSQFPGGWLAKIFGGRIVLGIGVLIWSIATTIVPFVAGFMPGLFLSRILVGIGEGASPSAGMDIIARIVPLEERSRAVACVFGSMSIGSVIGLLLAPPLIHTLGWGSVFYLFGALGITWFLGFQFVKGGELQLNTESLSSQDTLTPSWKTSLEHLKGSLKEVPWKAFFQNRSVWAMIYGSFCISWGNYNFGAWLPTYFSKELHLNLTEAAWVSILPPLAAIFFTLVAAQLADSLISRGVEITLVRKITQSIAFVAPAICLTLTVLDIAPSPWLVVGILTGGLSLTSFSFSGLYCTHQDISPEYASILVGITNTVGAIPGIVGVALTGFLLDATQSWSISLFLPAIFFYVTGTIVWLIFANNKPQSFSEKN